jgi:hypothetical protein
LSLSAALVISGAAIRNGISKYLFMSSALRNGENDTFRRGWILRRRAEWKSGDIRL